MTTLLYRFENHHDVVIPRTFRPTKTTPCGNWIDDYGTRRFVLNTGTKRFAYPTEEEAKISFLARKTRQLAILNRQAENVGLVIQAMKEGRISDYANSNYRFDL